jgi:hypothetical protein
MHDPTDQSTETLQHLRFGEDVRKIVHATCLDGVHNPSCRCLSCLVLWYAMATWAIQYHSVLDDSLIVAANQTCVLHFDSQTMEHVPERNELFHSILHPTEFGSISRGLDCSLSFAQIHHRSPTNEEDQSRDQSSQYLVVGMIQIHKNGDLHLIDKRLGEIDINLLECIWLVLTCQFLGEIDL